MQVAAACCLQINLSGGGAVFHRQTRFELEKQTLDFMHICDGTGTAGVSWTVLVLV